MVLTDPLVQIQATHLSKCFGQSIAVESLSLCVSQGEIYGLLGPNAAGKTTSIRMLCGILKADAGEVRIVQKPITQAKLHFGYVAQHFGQYEELSVWENLRFYARLYGVDDKQRLRFLLDRYDLAQFSNQRAGVLSGGYKRRLGICCALAHDPEVLFLDEPTAGIDPVTRKLLWDDFYRLSCEGKTLFLTTHYMEEAQRCHQLGFLSQGRLIAEGTPETIRRAIGDARVFAVRLPYLPEIHTALQTLPGVILLNQFGDELRIITDERIDQQQLVATIQHVYTESCTIHESTANLEDVFIALTQGRGQHS